MKRWIIAAVMAVVALGSAMLPAHAANGSGAGYLWIEQSDGTSSVEGFYQNCTSHEYTDATHGEEHSLGQIWLWGPNGYVMELGQMTDHAAFGDAYNRLFVSRWVNGTFEGYGAPAGFVWAGKDRDFEVVPWSKCTWFGWKKDGAGNWWMDYNGTWVGYWPAKDFPYSAVTYVQLGTEIYYNGWYYPTGNNVYQGYQTSGHGVLGGPVTSGPYKITGVSSRGMTTNGGSFWG